MLASFTLSNFKRFREARLHWVWSFRDSTAEALTATTT